MIITKENIFDLPIPKHDYDEDIGIQYGKHPCYTIKSKRLNSSYLYIRAGGIIHPPYTY